MGYLVEPPLLTTTDFPTTTSESVEEQRDFQRQWQRLQHSFTKRSDGASMEEANTFSGKIWGTLMALCGGTGANMGGAGRFFVDKDLARRMRLQNEVVLILLLLVYFVTLIFSGSL